ncbi:hypothetical protein Tco_0295614 [Tanacetum coccineum]
MSDSTGGMTDLDDMDDIEMIMQQLKYEQESSHRCNYIYREREDAEENVDDHRMLFMCLSDLGGQVNARGVPKASKRWCIRRIELVLPIPVSLYVGGVLEKDLAPHLTACQEQTVRLLENNKAPFRCYLECFLCLVGLSPYYPFDENTYPAFERPDGMEMGLLDFNKTADPRKVQAVAVVLLLLPRCLLLRCLLRLVEPENVVPEDTYLDLTEPDADLAAARPEEVATTQSGKSKRKRLVKQSDTLPAKQLRKDHPSLATGTGGKTLAGAHTADVPMYTAAATITSAQENVGVTPTSDVAGSSQLETSEWSDDSFYELAALNSAEAKRWYVPQLNITNDSLLDDGFSCRTLVDRVAPPGFFFTLRSMDYEQLYTEFNVGAAWQICLESEILKLKSLLAEEAEKAERAKTAEVVRLRNQVSALTAESALDDSQAACAKSRSLITSLTSERDRLTSEVSTLHSAFQDVKEKVEAQQEEEAQVLYNCVAELEAHVMDVSGHFRGGILSRLPDHLGWKEMEGLEAGYEHRVTGTQLSAIEAYNPEVARTSYFDAVRALEDVDFPLVSLLKSKKDAGMDEVLDCFILDGPLADLPEAAHLQPCLEQLSVPIHHSDDKDIVGETFLSFALLNVHSRTEGAKKHAAALRQLMMEIVSNPMSS